MIKYTMQVFVEDGGETHIFTQIVEPFQSKKFYLLPDEFYDGSDKENEYCEKRLCLYPAYHNDKLAIDILTNSNK